MAGDAKIYSFWQNRLKKLNVKKNFDNRVYRRIHSAKRKTKNISTSGTHWHPCTKCEKIPPGQKDGRKFPIWSSSWDVNNKYLGQFWPQMALNGASIYYLHLLLSSNEEQTLIWLIFFLAGKLLQDIIEQFQAALCGPAISVIYKLFRNRKSTGITYRKHNCLTKLQEGLSVWARIQRIADFYYEFNRLSTVKKRNRLHA